jgi:hypothetical protein
MMPLREEPSGVALLVINTDRAATQALGLATAAERYALTAQDLLDTRIRLNGDELKLGPGDARPQITGAPTRRGNVTFEPASITFLANPKANKASCPIAHA